MARHLAAGLAGEKRNGPGALARVLDEQRLREGLARAGKQRVRHLLDAGIDAAHHRNAVHQPLPLAQPPLAEHVGHEQARAQHHQRHQDHAQARDAAQLVGQRREAGHHRLGRGQHAEKDAVQNADQPQQHPHRDAHGQPHQQAGDEVLPQAGHHAMAWCEAAISCRRCRCPSCHPRPAPGWPRGPARAPEHRTWRRHRPQRPCRCRHWRPCRRRGSR